MRFSINRDYFIEQLNHVIRAIPSKTTMQILTGLKIELTNDQLILIGSDSNISIENIINVSEPAAQLTIIETGGIILTARLFIDIIKKLPTPIIEIEVNDRHTATIQSGKATFTLNGIHVNQYPKLPEISDTQELTIPSLLLKKMINQTIFSASNQETRPILTGLNITFHKTHLTGVTTDSHRLSKRDIPVETDLEQLSLTIPKKTVIELTRILDDDTDVSISIMNQQIIFSFANLVIYSRLLEGNFPEVNRLIPTQHNTRLVVNTQQFIQAIDRAALLARVAKSNVVQLNINENSVSLYVQGITIGNSTEEIAYESVSGSPLVIAFNPDYMLDAIRSFGEESIKLSFISGERPLLLETASDSPDPHNQLIQILTPIRTHN